MSKRKINERRVEAFASAALTAAVAHNLSLVMRETDEKVADRAMSAAMAMERRFQRVAAEHRRNDK